MPDMLPDLDRRAAKPLVFSYTILNTYENVCPHQMYRRYIKKDTPFVMTPDAQHGNDTHKAMELRVGGGKPLPQKLEALEPIARTFQARGAKTEEQMGLTIEGRPAGFFDAGVWYRGKVDVTIIAGDTAYLPDYKSGKNIREDPLELELNAVMIHARHPHLRKIVGQYVWTPDLYGTRLQPVLGPLHDLSDTARSWQHIRRVAAAIENDRKADEFEKRQGGLCGHCDVLDCQFNRKLARLAKEGKSA